MIFFSKRSKGIEFSLPADNENTPGSEIKNGEGSPPNASVQANTRPSFKGTRHKTPAYYKRDNFQDNSKTASKQKARQQLQILYSIKEGLLNDYD
jgi:hypothetical protein